MVSAQIKGTIKFYRITPTGSKVLLFASNMAALGPSGSSDAAIASTPEKWTYLPIQLAPAKVLQVNDKLHVTFTPDAAATTDASDGIHAIPITYQDGTSDVLSGSWDLTTIWDSFALGDVALIAAREYPVCEKIVRQPFALGSNIIKAFASIENNA